MPSTIQEVYRQQILPLSESERLKLAALIISDISNQPDRHIEDTSVRELFGSVSLGHPTGLDNEGIDADLLREYGSIHELD
jgi:hypothetical protein